MRPIRLLIACYVALCLPFAGMVGISPVLHQLIEHGGTGRPHLHGAGLAKAETSPHSHDDGHAHSAGHTQIHDHAQPGSQSPRTGLFVHSFEGFHAPRLFTQLWKVVADVLQRGPAPEPASTPTSDQNGHQHHSLAQSLAAGLVELSAVLPPLDAAFLPVTFCLFGPDTPLLAGGWDAQTASRGPPLAPTACG